ICQRAICTRAIRQHIIPRARGTTWAKQRSEWVKKQCNPAPRKRHRMGKATVRMGEKQYKPALSALTASPIPQ
ncbi:MAG: hypothetical protein RR946_09180, partial [Clostridia bacterium]